MGSSRSSSGRSRSTGGSKRSYCESGGGRGNGICSKHGHNDVSSTSSSGGDGGSK